MSEDPEKSKSEATSYTAELEINWEYYGYFQNVTDVNYQLEIKRMNEKCDITKKPGIYKLEPKNHREEGKPELYIGEAQNLFKRLNDYPKAGYKPNAKTEYTNRRIQGWIHLLNNFKNSENGYTEIFVCTEAFILCGNGEKQKLDLETKHNRVLIENLEISITPDNFKLQNLSENWAKNQKV
jgi:hypothetical protein